MWRMRYPGLKLAFWILFVWAFAALAHCQTNTNWSSVITIDAGAVVDLPDQPAGYQTKDRYFRFGTVYTDASMGTGAMSTLRFWTATAPGGYTITGLPAGQFLLRFYFSEPNKTAALQRLFKISVNGLMSDVIDVFGTVGARPARLIMETAALSYFGKISIDFVSVNSSNPFVNLIEVLPAFVGPSTVQTVAASYECVRGLAFAGQRTLATVGVLNRDRWRIQPVMLTTTPEGAQDPLPSNCAGIRAATFQRADGTKTAPYILIPFPAMPADVLDLTNPLYWKASLIP